MYCADTIRPQIGAPVISRLRMRNRLKKKFIDSNIFITDNRHLIEPGGSNKLHEIHLCLFQKYLPNDR